MLCAVVVAATADVAVVARAPQNHWPLVLIQLHVGECMPLCECVCACSRAQTPLACLHRNTFGLCARAPFLPHSRQTSVSAAAAAAAGVSNRCVRGQVRGSQKRTRAANKLTCGARKPSETATRARDYARTCDLIMMTAGRPAGRRPTPRLAGWRAGET